jgi:glycosyltransferase involved in cell wall biosynthesis
VNVFLLVSDLEPGDATEQFLLLARGLPRDQFVLSAGAVGPLHAGAADALRAAGVPVASYPIRGALDFGGMRRLRAGVLATNPAVVHAFGPRAVRAAQLVVTRTRAAGAPSVIASGATACGDGIVGWLARRALRRADRVLTTGWTEGQRYRRLCVPGERLSRVHLAVEPAPAPADRAAFCKELDVPTDSRLIFAGGALDPQHGPRDAVRAFDMLRYNQKAAQLVLFGDGPERQSCADLAKALAFDDNRVRFAGARSDLAAVTELADQVWVTRATGGELLALRALAAGVPVVAFDTPELQEVIDDGNTGYIVPQGDRPALAMKAQMLLSFPDTAKRMGAAGREWAERFSAARMIEQHARVYAELAS